MDLKEIIRLLLGGISNREIGKTLNISQASGEMIEFQIFVAVCPIPIMAFVWRFPARK